MNQPRRNRYRVKPDPDSSCDFYHADWRPWWWPFWINLKSFSSRGYCEELCVEHARKALKPGGADSFDPYARILEEDLRRSEAEVSILLAQERQTREPHLEALVRQQPEPHLEVLVRQQQEQLECLERQARGDGA